MEVLEAIKSRRTVRVPFKAEPVPDEVIMTLRAVSRISPSGDPISWRVEPVDDQIKSKLSLIVQEDFGNYFQKNRQRFKQVFSQYPRWLRFSEAADGIRLAGLPRAAHYFYRFALGPRFGPMFGKLGIMSAEIRSYRRNIIANPAMFGVFLDRRVSSPRIPPIINTGSMLQNLRLAATSLGLCYQDLGWITATKPASDKARELLGVPGDYAAVNFFRIGHAIESFRENKRSHFRRELKDIVHEERFGRRTYHGRPAGKTDIQVLDAIRGVHAMKDSLRISDDDLIYILEAARWTPTGFNVQPFEYLIKARDAGMRIVVLEDRDRRDPDPGPCEALARGGVMQNIRLAARAVGWECGIRSLTKREEETVKQNSHIPSNYSILAEVVFS